MALLLRVSPALIMPKRPAAALEGDWRNGWRFNVDGRAECHPLKADYTRIWELA